MTAAPKKRKKRAKPLMAAPRKRRVHHHHKAPARRHRRLSAGPRGTSIPGMLLTAGKGAIGGALHEAPRFVTKLSMPMQIGWDIIGTLALAKFAKSPTMSAGFAGAAAAKHMESMFSKAMHDNLEDYDYVDPSTLSDSGFDDEFGDPIVMDDDGHMYALNDDGESYHEIGHMDDFDDANVEDASMINLQANGYALQSGGNSYALQDDNEYSYRQY
jgi:hypothetical protein